MYEYNDANTTNYEYNHPTDPLQQNQAVPNVLFDDTKNIPAVQIQEGGNMEDINGGHQTLPMYAIDGTVPQFEIADPILRRNFVRKILYILLLQTLITLPIVGIVVLCDLSLHRYTFGATAFLFFFILVAMYIFSEQRRYPPMNLIALTVITILIITKDCIFASMGFPKVIFISRLMLIVQILAIILYTKQNRCKFTIFNSIILVLFMFAICICLVVMFLPLWHAITFSAEADAIYFVYDIYLMLSGHHGYNLQPHEHIFAATNIYADKPNLGWRIFKFILITPIVKIYRFLMSCCLAEVC